MNDLVVLQFSYYAQPCHQFNPSCTGWISNISSFCSFLRLLARHYCTDC